MRTPRTASGPPSCAAYLYGENPDRGSRRMEFTLHLLNRGQISVFLPASVCDAAPLLPPHPKSLPPLCGHLSVIYGHPHFRLTLATRSRTLLISSFGGVGAMPTKAAAAGGTALLAGALTTVVLSLWGHPVTPDMQGAIQTLLTAVLAGLGAYLPKMENGG